MMSFSGPPSSTGLGGKKAIRIGAILLVAVGILVAVGTWPQAGRRPNTIPTKTASLPVSAPAKAPSLPGSDIAKPRKSEFEHRIALDYPRLDALYKHLHR